MTDHARPLADQVTRSSLAILLSVVVTVGLATGVLLYVQARRELDHELLVAARAAGASEWGTEHVVTAVSVRMLGEDDPLLPAGWAENAEQLEEPEWRTMGTERVLLLPVERGPEDNEEHRMLVATAPALTLAHSVGPFVLLYTLSAGTGAAVGAWAQRRLLRAATAPLAAAKDAVTKVVGAGAGARVPEGGPPEVRALLQSVNALLQRLDYAFAAQARFTAEAAHELRTPITAMLGEIDVALRRPRDAAEYVEVLGSAREEVQRLSELVEGLLLLARVDAGHAEQGRDHVDIATLVTEAARRERPAIDRAGGQLVLPASSRCVVHGHPALLVSALGNLLRNAAVHAPGTPVEVHVERAEGVVRIVVDDAGPGVAPADREPLFDRLSRQPSARRGSAGLGLGLPLAREIARRHGGDCTIAESPKGGCRATLSLPSAEP